MSQERLMQVLVGPHVSEKGSMLADSHNQVAFKVLKDASKAEVKGAVELMFNVKVKSVSVLNVKGKAKRFGRTQGRRRDWKKAYVTLEEGHDINFVGAE